MDSKRLADFTIEQQRDIIEAFRLGKSLTRRLIVYPIADVLLWSALAASKWEVLTAPVQKLPALAGLALMETVPLAAIAVMAAVPAYLISRKAANATYRFNEILNSSNRRNKAILDRIIQSRIHVGGTIIGTMNGVLGAGIIECAYIALAPQPENLITPVAPIAIGVGLGMTGLTTMYNYFWQQSLRALRNEISHFAGVINLEEDLGRPKLTDRTKIDKPFRL